MLTYGLLSLLQTEFDGFALVIPLCRQIDVGILNVQEAMERFEADSLSPRGWLRRARITLPTGMSSIRIARVVHAHPRTTLG